MEPPHRFRTPWRLSRSVIESWVQVWLEEKAVSNLTKTFQSSRILFASRRFCVVSTTVNVHTRHDSPPPAGCTTNSLLSPRTSSLAAAHGHYPTWLSTDSFCGCRCQKPRMAENEVERDICPGSTSGWPGAINRARSRRAEGT